MAYLTAEKLMRFLGRETYIALHDDSDERLVDSDDFLANVAETLANADASTTAWIANTYSGVLPFPEPVPAMVEQLAKFFARAHAWNRNVDYLLRLREGKGPDWMAQAEALGEKIQSSVLRMVDAPAPVPTNVGGDVSSAAGADEFPCPRRGTFSNMGDF